MHRREERGGITRLQARSLRAPSQNARNALCKSVEGGGLILSLLFRELDEKFVIHDQVLIDNGTPPRGGRRGSNA